MYTYINRHAEPPNITKQKTLKYIVNRVVIIYDKSGIKQYKNEGSFLLFCWIDCCGSKGARRKQKNKNKKAPPKNNSCFMVPVGRSVGWAGFPSGKYRGVEGLLIAHHNPPPPPLQFHCQHSTPHMPP